MASTTILSRICFNFSIENSAIAANHLCSLVVGIKSIRFAQLHATVALIMKKKFDKTIKELQNCNNQTYNKMLIYRPSKPKKTFFNQKCIPG
jgi:hypothetical protein